MKNYRPVANLSFISKIIEKAIATQIHSHLINNDIVDNFQSAYKTGHSCETALLRVYNDIVTRGDWGPMSHFLDFREYSRNPCSNTPHIGNAFRGIIATYFKSEFEWLS